jgi:hypothetical protein
VTAHDENRERSFGGMLNISDNLLPSHVRAITGDGVELPSMSYAQQQTMLQNHQRRQQIQQLQQQRDFLRQQQEDDYNMMSAVPELPLLYENTNDVYSRLMPGVSSGAATTRPADRGRAEGMFLNDMYSPRTSTIFPSVTHRQHQYHQQQQQQHREQQQQQQQQQQRQRQLTAQHRQQMPPPVSIPVQRISNPAVYYLPVPISPHAAPGTVTHAVLGGMRVRIIVESVDQPPSPSRDIAAAPQDYRQVREPESAARARARQSNPNAGHHKTDRRQDDDDDIVAANLLMLKTSMPKKKSSKSKSSKPSTSKPAKKMTNLSMF